MGIAFFDLDGTITRKDTFIEFIKFSRGQFLFFVGIVILSPFILLYLLKIYPNHKLKELFFTFYFKNYTKSELQYLGDDFGKIKMPNIVYEKAIDKIKMHQLKGDRIIILTASSSIWLSYWCKQNNVDLISTQFEIIKGKYNGKIYGENCFGKQKQKIVKKILTKEKISDTYGYGDSKSDLHFLNELKYYELGAIKK